MLYESSEEDSYPLCPLEEISEVDCLAMELRDVNEGPIMNSEHEIRKLRSCEKLRKSGLSTDCSRDEGEIANEKVFQSTTMIPEAIYIVDGHKRECISEMKHTAMRKDDNKYKQRRHIWETQQDIKTVRECSNDSGVNQALSQQFGQKQCENKRFDNSKLVAVPSATGEKVTWRIKTDVENDENKCSNSIGLSAVKVINATYLSCHPTKDANKTQEQGHETNDTQQNQDQSSSFQARDATTKILIQNATDLSQGLNGAKKNNDTKDNLTRRTSIYSSRQNEIWKENDVNEKLDSMDLIDGAKILKSDKKRNLTQTDLIKEKVTSVKKSICATKNHMLKKDLQKMCAKFYPIFNQKNNVES